MLINNAIASLAVRDLQKALPWYAALLGRAPDSQPMAEVAEWQFAGGGWLQVYQQQERAGQGSCTLAVGDIEAVTAHVGALGIDTRDQNPGRLVRTLMIIDPDGNHIAFAEALDPTMAH